MRLPGKSKDDGGKPAKPDKPSKGDKADAGDKKPKSSLKGDASKYFWNVYLDKKRAAKANIRPSSLPKQPMSKEDRMKLIGCGVLVLMVPIILIIINIIGSHAPPPTTK